MQIPKHLAIIMDGNGRWAQQRGKGRTFGHIKGSRRAKSIIEESSRLGIESLTLYAFSVENWRRPEYEIRFLMKILDRYIKRETDRMMKQNIRFSTIGDITRLPSAIYKELIELKKVTKNNTGMKLNLALSYGSRQEITAAVRRACEMVRQNKLNPEDVNESLVNTLLETADLPDPDLIIRTSGEYRLSNFMLWQSAYSELYITATLWPDFSLHEFHKALTDYGVRQRRFGLTGEQIQRSTDMHGINHS